MDAPAAAVLNGVRSVRATVNYVADGGGRGVYEIYDDDRSSLPLQPTRIDVHDARTAPVEPSLEREGFTVVQAPTAVSDFADQDEIQRTYIPELAETIRQRYRAAHVWMAPGTVVRTTDAGERTRRVAADAARFLHLDYSVNSAPRFLEQTLGYDPDVAKRYRRIFAINTWRSISPPPQDVPLAVCDQRTSSLEDLVIADARYDSPDGPVSFEISLVRHNPSHQWWYFSDMSPGELLIFKGWDLSPQPTPSVLHGAFVDPSCPPDAPLRTSIEARGFALFED